MNNQLFQIIGRENSEFTDVVFGYFTDESLAKKALQLMPEELIDECEIRKSNLALNTIEVDGKVIDFNSETNDDAIYRKVWKEHVIEDIESHLEDIDIHLDEDTIDLIATRYVYDGDYDCNICYWDNLDHLIDEYAREEDYFSNPRF